MRRPRSWKFHLVSHTIELDQDDGVVVLPTAVLFVIAGKGSVAKPCLLISYVTNTFFRKPSQGK